MPTAFRVFSELDTFFGQSGQLLAGGYLKTYEAGTTTPKDTYGEEALSTNNGDTVDLDSSGRPGVDMWATGSLFIEVYDSDDVKQGEADDVQIPGGDAQTVPVPDTGEFLTGDGTNFSTQEIREVPDPSGHSGQQLGTDGTDVFWEDKPDVEVPDPEIVVGTKRFQAGVSTDDTKKLELFGSGSAPSTSAKSTSASVTFPETFGELWFVSIQPTITAATPSGALVDWSVVATTSGFTVYFNVSDDDDNSSWKISNAITFNWKAEGTKEIAA